MSALEQMEQPVPAEEPAWRAIRQQVLDRDGNRCVSCHSELRAADADIHHLLPRSMGGTDELSNLVTLCDGCHAKHHPTLAGGLARRAIERWAMRLAKWLDREGLITESTGNFGPALRLFGLERFRHGQLPIVLAALSGKSILVVSPTGSGKTLCFQLPALLRRGVALVVSPLKALMAEQVSDLLGKKIPATFINSDLGTDEKGLRYSLLTRQAIKLLYVAPERFFVRSDKERSQFKQNRPSFLVVDEAHCVDQWGGTFAGSTAGSMKSGRSSDRRQSSHSQRPPARRCRTESLRHLAFLTPRSSFAMSTDRTSHCFAGAVSPTTGRRQSPRC